MRHSMIILARELGERRVLWWLGLLGLVPLWLPLLGVLGPETDTQLAVALILTCLGAAVLALLLGATVLGSDLAERRLGFYFSRPVSELSIWAGKMGASVVQALGIGGLLLLPTVLVHGWPGPVLMTAGEWIGGIGTIFLLAAAAHAIGVIIRSRDAWLALDLAVLGGVGLTLLILLQNLYWKAGATGLVTRPLLIAGGLGAFALAGALQVLRGRTDLKRGHRLLSLTLAATLVPLALGQAAYNRWFFHPGVGDLVGIRSASASPEGRWIALEGPAAHRGLTSFAFLVEPEGRRRQPIEIAPMTSIPSTVSYSADGRRALWLAPRPPREPGSEIMTLDLKTPGSQPVTSLVGFEGKPQWLAFSPKGTRVAAPGRGGITVSEIDSGRLVTQIRTVGSIWGVDFLGEDRLRVGESVAGVAGAPESGEGVEYQAFAVDLKTGRRISTTADLEGIGLPSFFTSALPLANGMSFPDVSDASGRTFQLSSDLVALVTRKSGGRQVELRITGLSMRPGTEVPMTFRLNETADLLGLRQIDPRRLVAMVVPAGPDPDRRPPAHYVLLDLEHGTQRDLGPTALFAVTPPFFVFRDTGGPVALDLRTGQERRLGDS